MKPYTLDQIQQSKNVNLLDVAFSECLKPLYQTPKGVFFVNPFRKDKKPSFIIFKSRSGAYLAKDFGQNERAMDSITFIQKLKNMNFQQSVGWLLSFDGATSNNHSFSFTKNNTQLSEGIELRKIQPLQNKALINYLKSRNIDINFVSKCPLLFEFYYRLKGKPRKNGRDFFALAFKNIAGGYDLRSSTFKGKYGTNSYSYIPHSKSDNIAVFEGFTDYLSALTFYKVDHSKTHILILNSTENKQKPLSMLQKFDKVFLYLDNDDAGKKAVDFFKKNLEKVFDQSHIYKYHNDFNQFLTK